jgi:hypothetical protein
MYDDVTDFDRALEQITRLMAQVRSKLGNRPLRIELAHQISPKSTPFRVPSGLGPAIDQRIAAAGMDALHLLRALQDANTDAADNPGKVDVVKAAIEKLKLSIMPLAAEVASLIDFDSHPGSARRSVV